MKNIDLTQEELQKHLHYNEDTGEFFRLTGQHASLIKRAGCAHPYRGHRYAKVNNISYLEHRLAWLYVHGVFPPDEIDHINQIRDDNRLANLRLASAAENKRNTGLACNNKSGVQGVHFSRQAQKWIASIQVNRTKIYLGSFDSKEDASEARKFANIKYNFHPNHGSKLGVQS